MEEEGLPATALLQVTLPAQPIVYLAPAVFAGTLIRKLGLVDVIMELQLAEIKTIHLIV
jgi:hypothetical protein